MSQEEMGEAPYGVSPPPIGPVDMIDRIPSELKERPQWVAFDSRKVPKDPKSGRNAKTNDPGAWGTFAQALELCQARQLRGIGFVFYYQDAYAGIDLDKCRDPKTGEVEPWARKIIDRLNSYTEISISGSGVHILLKAKLDKGRRVGQIEAYDRGRYFTMTGQHLEGTPETIEDRQAELSELLRDMEPGRVIKESAAGGKAESVPFKESIPKSQRHNFLAAIGISLRKWGLSEKIIAAGLWALYQSCCEMEPEPLSEREVRRIAKSAAQYPVDWRLVNMKAGPMEARQALLDLGGAAPYTPLVARIQESTGCGVRAAKRGIANAVKWALINKPDKKYGYKQPYTVSGDSDNARIAHIVDEVLRRGAAGEGE